MHLSRRSFDWLQNTTHLRHTLLLYALSFIYFLKIGFYRVIQSRDGIYARVQLTVFLSQWMGHTWQLLDEMVRLLHLAILIVCSLSISFSLIYFSMHPGYLRVFDYAKEHLICGGKSYYGGLLCCAWRWVMFGFGQFIRDWHVWICFSVSL